MAKFWSAAKKNISGIQFFFVTYIALLKTRMGGISKDFNVTD